MMTLVATFMARLALKLTYRVPIVYKSPSRQLVSGKHMTQSMACMHSVQDKDIALLKGKD